jgi:hypothetical protein
MRRSKKSSTRWLGLSGRPSLQAIAVKVCLDDNLSVAHDEQAVERYTRQAEAVRCAEVDQLSELLRIHALLFRGGDLPFLRWPDCFCCGLLCVCSPLQIEAPDMNAASATARKFNLSLRELFGGTVCALFGIPASNAQPPRSQMEKQETRKQQPLKRLREHGQQNA